MSKTVLTNGKKSLNGMKRILLLVGLAIAAALPAQAADYVISYTSGGTTYYLGMDGNDLVAKTQFDLTCIWQGYYGGDAALSTSRINIRNKNNTSYYLYYYDNSFIAYTSNQRRWYGEDGSSIYYNNSGTTRYIHNDGSTITASNSATGAFVPYQVTTNNVAEAVTGSLSTPAITPSAAQTIEYDGSFSYTASATGPTRIVPAHTTYTFNGTTIYYYNNQAYTSTNAFATNNPAVTYTWALSGDGASALELMSTTGENTIVKYTGSATGTTATLTVTAKAGTTTRTASVTINVTPVEPTAISATNATVYVGNSGEVVYTLTPDYAYHRVTATSGNTGIFTVTSPATSGAVSVTPVAAGQATLTLTALNSDGSNGPSTTATVTVRDICAAPQFSFAQSGSNVVATITCATPGATIRYTTDGTDPTPTTGTAYSGPFTSANGQTIKAIAVLGDYYDASEIVTKNVNPIDYVEQGVSGGIVTLNDLEDHTWTYYSGVSSDIDGGNYNTNYLGKLYNPNPRNVKITYKGVNGISGSSTTVKVSRDESETQFVYFKTLEESSTSGEYKYQVISNPFSVRPSTGTGSSKVYYGFAGWKIVRGGAFIKGHNNNDILDLDEEIIFENLDDSVTYSPNCTSAEIVFQTTWTIANVQTGNNISNMLSNFSGGTYETNFAVMTGQYTTAWTGNKNATITSVYPDGSSDERSTTNYTRLNVTVSTGYTIKYEYININNNSTTFTMGTGTKTLYIGRGVGNTTANGVCCNIIQGFNNSINSGGLSYTLKIESGIYNYLSYAKGYDGNGSGNTVTGAIAIKSILGCDYDRAKNANNLLKIQNQFMFGYGTSSSTAMLQSPSAGDEVLNVTIKSGNYNSSRTNAGTADASQSFYIGVGNSYCRGYRSLTIEGGEFWSIAAGICQNTSTTNSIRFRIKGGLIKGSIYGSAANANSYGYKQMIITGGEVKGWIAGGGNGTSDNGGTTTGSSYIYVGGKSRVDSEGNNTKINSSVGGQVFGSGSGVDGSTTWGEMLYGTNVVIADNAYVERNVFGGGNFGWTDLYATIYLTGDKMSTGSVFGGANQNKGENVMIYMTGGTVRDGIYGGSNVTGTISGNVTMQINGGQVGTTTTPANIHGGGYGQATRVSQNVDITLGSAGQTTPGVTVYGDVYGGSALGYVNGTTGTNTYHTKVTLNAGTINGSLYGGGLGAAGTAANVYGPVTVTVNGGSVKQTSADGSGGVYGCNNIYGAPQRAVAVTINGTDPAPSADAYALHSVYGGGNRANYTYGTPTVTVNNCDNSIAYVYGGGNAAAVPATDVTIYGGNKIGTVFGGGNGTVSAANVTGNTAVKVYGGTIGQVYGGSNSSGTIGGTISVTVNKTSSCPMKIGQVFGGGNQAASQVGSITIGCTGTLVTPLATGQRYGYDQEGIGAVYGGANNAGITGDITLNIVSGIVDSVFGGNNAGGAINGDITVTIEKTGTCGWYVGYVFGGGNMATYSEKTSGHPAVNVKAGKVTHHVFGGGNGSGAAVTGNPTVTLSGTAEVGGNVFGGGNAAAVTGNTKVLIKD